MQRKLTDTRLRGLKPREQRYEVRDGGGLALWVYPTGRRSWVYTYEIQGKKRRRVLGEYPALSLAAARDAHDADRSLVGKGVDPVEAEKQSRAQADAERSAEAARRAAEEATPTVSRLAELYIEKWAKPNKKTWAEDDRKLEKEVKPHLGNLKVRDVTRGHVRGLLGAVVDRGSPVAANRLLALLQRMFSWAVEQDLLLSSPCQGIKMPSRETPKDRVLTPEEIRVFWRALEAPPSEAGDKDSTSRVPRGGETVPAVAISDEVRRGLKLILVTAQRPGEVAGMRWQEIEGSWWTIPAERAKNGLSHRVHLSGLALELLGPEGREFVLPSSRKGGGPVQRSAFAHALRKNREAIGVFPEFTPHDLRRTAASLMAGAGVNPFTVERVLNHSLRGVQQIYNRHSYDPEKRQALETWAWKLDQLLKGQDGADVIPFPRPG